MTPPANEYEAIDYNSRAKGGASKTVRVCDGNMMKELSVTGRQLHRGGDKL
ncbi:hypothetical protein JOB18_006019 [Solea senegalensis]|uniref:Uncharacterized protein n=1 Tax=Solea senegalensis TaxID=28829 RepID=A0AAV6QS05_SOLSE|nr:hypothetical protein JOB18_006019 [Solea senegalensis]